MRDAQILGRYDLSEILGPSLISAVAPTEPHLPSPLSVNFACATEPDAFAPSVAALQSVESHAEASLTSSESAPAGAGNNVRRSILGNEFF